MHGREQSRRAVRVVRVFLTTVVAALAIGAGECPGYVAAPSSDTCPNNGFKCIHNLNTQGYTCMQWPGATVDVAYVCLGNGGTLKAIPTTSIEELSAYVNRNSISCAAKVRCTR